MTEETLFLTQEPTTHRECVTAGDIINKWLKRSMICESPDVEPSLCLPKNPRVPAISGH